MSGQLEGVRALIVGGASGIGAAVGSEFEGEGATVAIADIAKPADVIIDVRDAWQVRDGVAAAIAELGGLDAVVYAAGRPVVGPIAEVTTAEWDDGFAINARGLMLVAQAAWSALGEGGGSITAIASAVGLRPTAGQVSYCASKAACVMLTRCLAMEGAADRIRANSICPGFVETPMLSQFLHAQDDPDAARDSVVEAHPLGRLGTPRDIARAAVFLASGDGAWITGTEQVVDGGLSVGMAA